MIWYFGDGLVLVSMGFDIWLLRKSKKKKQKKKNKKTKKTKKQKTKKQNKTKILVF